MKTNSGKIILFLLGITPMLLGERPAIADSCTFTYTCGGSCGELGSSGTIGPIPGGPAYCQTVRAGDIFAWEMLGSTITASGCNCSGGSGTGIAVGIGNVGGLTNDVGVFSPAGPESGQPFFTTHSTESFERWQAEVEQRSQGYASLGKQRRTSLSSLQYQRRFVRRLRSRYCDPGPCRLTRRFSNVAVGSKILPIAPKYEVPTTPPSMTGDSQSGGTPIQGGGTPIGGVGVQTGAKDTPPPATPTQVEGDGLCKKNWWYNNTTQLCYPARKNCMADGVANPSRECLLQRTR